MNIPEKVYHLMLECADLLASTGWGERAEWFHGKVAQLKALPPSSSEIVTEIANVRYILAGMGSFTDLPMKPRPGSDLSEAEATEKKWILAEHLGAAIEEAFRNEGIVMPPRPSARAATRQPTKSNPDK